MWHTSMNASTIVDLFTQASLCTVKFSREFNHAEASAN